MIDQEHDWLDERLAESPYIADGGFTERVVAHLPHSTLKDEGRVRRRILAFAGCSSFALGAVLGASDVPAFMQKLAPVANGTSITYAAGQFAELIREPMFFYSGAAAIAVSCFAMLPFLRRWV